MSFDSEKRKLSFSPKIISKLKLKTTFRKEINSDILNINKFRVPINIIIGNPKNNIIIGISRLRNRVINPILFRSFLEKGRVCSHLNEFPDINELVETIPNNIMYKNVMAKYIPKTKLDINKIVFIVYVPSSRYPKSCKYETNGKRGINRRRIANINLSAKN